MASLSQSRSGKSVDGCAFPGIFAGLLGGETSFLRRNESMPGCNDWPSIATILMRSELLFGGSKYVDEILCRLQSFVEKVALVRFRALPVWMGVGRLTRSRFGVVRARTKLKGGDTTMAKIIEFYVPDGFHNLPPEVPKEHRGKILMFRPRLTNLVEIDSDKSHHSVQIKNISESNG